MIETFSELKEWAEGCTPDPSAPVSHHLAKWLIQTIEGQRADGLDEVRVRITPPDGITVRVEVGS